jgi:hypothetical protein
MGWEQHLDNWRKIIYCYRDRPIVLGKGTGILEQRPKEKSEADNVFDGPAFDLMGLPYSSLATCRLHSLRGAKPLTENA